MQIVVFAVLGPLQTVQRAEPWEVLSALQGEAPTHIGVDNLKVVNNILSIGEVEAMVGDGRVRQLDWLGNDAADEAADFGRRRVSPGVLG